MPKLLRFAIIVLVLASLAYIFYASSRTAQFRVKVCVTFAGQTACATAAGRTRADAERAAHDTACGQIASGVTDTVACQRTRATSVEWLQ